MEQGNRLDSTPVSAVQAVRDDAGEDRALDAAVAALLTRPDPERRPADDHELLQLGAQFDAAHQRWLDAVEANREPSERLSDFIKAAKARGGPTLKDVEAAWTLPGVTEAEAHEDDAFGMVADGHGLKILKVPAKSLAGLAVHARAVIPTVWLAGNYEEDADLGENEDLPQKPVRLLIQSVLRLAGVDWKGTPLDAERVAIPAAGASSRRPAGSASPELASMVAEWVAAIDTENNGSQDGPDDEERIAQRITLQQAILAFPVTSFADLAAKAPLFQDEVEAASRSDASSNTLEALAWQCVLRDIASLSGEPAPPPEPKVNWNNPPAGFMAFPAIEPTGFINIVDRLRLEAERLHEIDRSSDLPEDRHDDVHPPALLREIAAEGMLLANSLIEYFGKEPIDKVLTTDIALRDHALRVRALGGNVDFDLDAELVSIGQEWPGLVAEMKRTFDRLDDANEALNAPEMPRELRVYGYDVASGFPLPHQTAKGYAPYGSNQIEELRATPRMGVFIGGKPEGELLAGGGYRKVDQNAQKRAEAIIAAWDGWRAEVERRELAHDIPGLRMAAQAATRAHDAAALRARSLKAHTARGLIVKAEIAASLIPWADRDAQAEKLDADDEVGILYALVSDTLRVLGSNASKQAPAS
ncbi:hypothetical protein [Methylobacterium sp. Leaf100]|uniref:hypothetical protein n=1 Tax=Methylobacterium sp. Leaf100 TaxID=1736252 RepID=UPI0006FF699F|nr:hypothetical protein [Methylobacterium sp. Leaf100]KQP35963.1 hypothetical protein ASF25_13415 [Methylobacterium sp. Leaf100]